MASFTLKRVPGVGIQNKYVPNFSTKGEALPRRPQFNSMELLETRPGQRGWFPTGTDYAPNLPFTTKRGRV